MNQKGLAPFFILIIGAVVTLLAGFIYFKQNSKTPQIKPTNFQQIASNSATPASSPTNQPSQAPKQTIIKPTPTLLKSVSTPSPAPTATPNTNTTSTQPQSTQKNTCEINVIYGKLDGSSSDPYLVTLVYSFPSHNNTYMTGAQWDFDGNGTWDTDLKQANGTIEHTFNGGGNYNVRLQLQDSGGTMTDVCTKTINIPGAIDVSVNGQVYNDLNCNHSKDSGETGVATTLTVMNPNGSVYANLSTDANGNYSFSKRIKAGDSLPVQLEPADHNVIFSSQSTILNQQNPSATINLSHCP